MCCGTQCYNILMSFPITSGANSHFGTIYNYTVCIPPIKCQNAYVLDGHCTHTYVQDGCEKELISNVLTAR